MAIRIEISGVQHPYELCMLCRDALGWNKITIEPGHPNQRDVFSCMEHLGDLLKDFGDAVIRRLEEEKDDGG